MDTLIHADIFFFVTTIAVIVLLLLFVIILFYTIQIVKNFRDISDTLKKGVDKTSGHIDALYQNIKDNPILRFIFGTKTRKKKAKKESTKQ